MVMCCACLCASPIYLERCPVIYTFLRVDVTVLATAPLCSLRDLNNPLHTLTESEWAVPLQCVSCNCAFEHHVIDGWTSSSLHCLSLPPLTDCALPQVIHSQSTEFQSTCLSVAEPLQVG